MTTYTIMASANATATSPINTDAQIVQPSKSGFFDGSNQQWEAVLTGTGSCTATVQLAGSNDAVNWSPISTIALAATSADLVPAVGAYQGNNQFAFYGAYLTVLTGTNAAVGLTLST